MRKALPVLVTVLACGWLSVPAHAEVRTLAAPEPAWLTEELKAEIHAAGAEGVQVSEEYLNAECPGVAFPGVSANGCIVSPAGCTANFVFTNGAPHIGTAAHCTDKVGDVVIMQVDTTTLAEVGTVVKRTAEEEPGEDFALIQIFPDVAAKWGVNPAIPTGGPQGIFTGCDPGQVVKNYGHGYGVAVAQGKPEAGVTAHWYDDAYGWFGAGIMGDSGSGITLATNESAGNFTHIILVDPSLALLPGELAGMRTTEILRFLGPGWAQVNADGSTSTATSSCGTSVDGGSGGGSAGGGKPDKGGMGGGSL